MLLPLVLLAALAVHPGYLPRPAEADTATPLAVLMSCRGDVSVAKKDGTVHKAAFGMPLEAGDEVRTGKGAEAEILFEDGNYISVGAGSNMKMRGSRNRTEPAEPTSPLGEESFELAQNYIKLKTAQGTSSIAGLRSSDRGEELRTLSPRQTLVADANPVFTWETESESDELRLTVYSDSGVLWENTVKDRTDLKYPAEAPELKAGTTYSWTVETTDPLKFPPLRSGAAYFGMISPAKHAEVNESLAAIDKDKRLSEASRHVMRASVYFNAELLADAIAETEKAVALSPGDATLRSILAHLYQETGRVDEAVELYNEILDDN
jgi:tetratricopeptide (TPR) repeat protein